MGLDHKLAAAFKESLRRSRGTDREAWEQSTRLVAPASIRHTVGELVRAIRTSSISPLLRDELLSCFQENTDSRAELVLGDKLKGITGLPATKALRGLCVMFGVSPVPSASRAASRLESAQAEDDVRAHPSPYDILLNAEPPSVLDLGAGDLSFALELTEQYLPKLRERGQELVLHCLERLSPTSQLGAVLHADRKALDRLSQHAPGLRFRFWSDQDMFDLEKARGLQPLYSVVTCHAPATPTFACEPSRLSSGVIDRHLRETKGEFRKVRVDGEEALEVLHGGRSLLFPPWKFEIRGPLALLDLLSRRGSVCVLSAVDTDVFWELLSQLVADDRMRPGDTLFTTSTRPEIFGPLHRILADQSVGSRVDLSSCADLRQDLPRVLPRPDNLPPTFRFRYVELRRGAVFQGVPASRTARLFKDMPEEAPPWQVVLIPQD